jgi:DNA replication protein DnaC
MQLRTNESKCKLCNDIGSIAIEKNGKSYITPCHCHFRAVKRKRFGSEYEDKTLDNWIPKTKSQEQAMATIKKNAVNKNYFIWGDVRLGKTHLLAGIYDEMYKAGKWERVYYFTEENLLKEVEIRDDFRHVTRRKELENKIEDGEVTGFILDDILKVKVNDLQIQSMYYFYEAVAKWNCQLIISCNFGLDTVLDAYGAAICSRIDERCQSIHIE